MQRVKGIRIIRVYGTVDQAVKAGELECIRMCKMQLHIGTDINVSECEFHYDLKVGECNCKNEKGFSECLIEVITLIYDTESFRSEIPFCRLCGMD
jgi:hypothetical protein